MPTIKIDSDNVKEYTLKSDTLDICQTCNKEITIHPINIGNFVICTVPICSFKCPRCRGQIHQLFDRGFECLSQHFEQHIQDKCQCVTHQRCESCLTYVEKGNDHQCSSHVNSQGQIEHKVLR